MLKEIVDRKDLERFVDLAARGPHAYRWEADCIPGNKLKAKSVV